MKRSNIFADLGFGAEEAQNLLLRSLMKDFIEPLGVTCYKVAKLAGVQQRRIRQSVDYGGYRATPGETVRDGRCVLDEPASAIRTGGSVMRMQDFGKLGFADMLPPDD